MAWIKCGRSSTGWVLWRHVDELRGGRRKERKPIMVGGGGKGVRGWGYGQNDEDDNGNGKRRLKSTVLGVGLSSSWRFAFHGYIDERWKGCFITNNYCFDWIIYWGVSMIGSCCQNHSKKKLIFNTCCKLRRGEKDLNLELLINKYLKAKTIFIWNLTFLKIKLQLKFSCCKQIPWVNRSVYFNYMSTCHRNITVF